jgi:phenylpyruvate tautomerase PptA (4-oxalocrotonate tautomerase family)
MPFARISLLAGKSPDYLKAISNSFHKALVETFEVPEKDRFQVFHQLQPNELVFDRDYLGGPRSDDFVHFHVSTGKPRARAVKQRFYRRLVQCLAEAPGIRPEDVMVIIAESPYEDWSFSSGICAATPSEAVA